MSDFLLRRADFTFVQIHYRTVEAASQDVEVHGNSIPDHHWSHTGNKIPPCNCPNTTNNDDEKQSDGWTSCDIARKARDEYIFDEDVHDHLSRYYHGERELCWYGSECRAFTRLENNEAYRLDDLCHVLIFIHPPRRGKIEKTKRGYNPMSLQKDSRLISCIAKTRHIVPQIDTIFVYESVDHLPFLILEVEQNGFGMDLVLKKPKKKKIKKTKRNLKQFCQTLKVKLNEIETKADLESYFCESPAERLSSDIDESLITLMKIVRLKLNHPRHLNIPDDPRKRLNYGEMLSLILYSGCDCNYDVCKVMRDDSNKNYRDKTISLKWKIFEYCLYRAIRKLHEYDEWYKKTSPVYSGIGRVLFNRDLIREVNESENGVQFSAFISTSRSIKVATSFRGNKGGIILRIPPHLQHQLKCCDISWISKFPDEEEVLFNYVSTQRWRLGEVKTYLVGDEGGEEEGEKRHEQFVDLVEA